VQNRIGKSACDQCRYCTELCPRYLLGYAVEPHQVMRSLAFTATGAAHWNEWATMCCSCGLCTLYACPEELFPKEACDQSKAEMKKANVKWTGPTTVKPHPMREGRRLPIKTLMKKLHIMQYDDPAHWQSITLSPQRVVLPLKQGAGSAGNALVRPGDRVREGQMIGDVPEKTLGAAIHAPFAATVAEVTANHIVLTR
jgi:Na+-translocating ferredoxin:NAD+ oxidoreductase RnfC subunit